MALIRSLYAFRKMWQQRHALAQLRAGQLGYLCQSLHHLDWSRLTKQGVEVIVLDFDGVLAPYGQTEVDEDCFGLMANLLEQFKVYVLTNKPFPERMKALNARFPALHLMTGVRRKPYPDGLIAIQKHASIEFNKMLVVDDRLLTGILASLIVGAKVVYAYPARKNYQAHFLKEMGFQFLRVLERALVFVISLVR